MDERLEEVNRLYRTMQGKGWQSYKKAGDLPQGFVYDQTIVRPIEERNLSAENLTNIPMELPGGEVLGELGITEDDENPLTNEDKAFLEQVSTQVALALESARLFEQTQQALNEVQRLGSAVEQSVDGMAIASMDGTIQFVNRAWATMHGYTTEELIGQPLTVFHTEEQLKNEVAPFNDAVAENGVNQGEVGHKRKDGSTFPTWMTVSIMKNDDGIPVALVASAQDITERKETEKAIAKRAAELATVAEVSTAAARALNTETLLQDVVDLTRKRFDLYHTHIYLLDKEKDLLEVQACGWEDGSTYPEDGDKQKIPLSAERSIVAQAMRNRQAVVVNNVHEDPNWLPNKLLPKTQSEMAVPLIVGDEILGVYDIQSDELDRFTDEDVSIQTTLASQVAVALQNARSYQQAQQLAEHESLINVIGQRIQGTTSVEDALQVAVRELGRALGAKQASIQLNVGAKKKS
jgi:PAS domain S-box-containing protein